MRSIVFVAFALIGRPRKQAAIEGAVVHASATTARTLELAGAVAITNADGTDLDRVAVPASVAVTPLSSLAKGRDRAADELAP